MKNLIRDNHQLGDSVLSLITCFGNSLRAVCVCFNSKTKNVSRLKCFSISMYFISEGPQTDYLKGFQRGLFSLFYSFCKI